MPDLSAFRPDPRQAALVIVDVQEKLSAAMPMDVLQQVVRHIGVLVAAANEFHFPVLLTEQYPQGLGATLEAVKSPLADVTPLEKMSFSCCGVAEFCRQLQVKQVRDILLVGMETHVCVTQTALDLLTDQYRVFVPADAVCSRNKQNWRLGLELMRQAGAIIGSTEMFLFMMLGEAGTDRFRKLSKLVR